MRRFYKHLAAAYFKITPEAVTWAAYKRIHRMALTSSYGAWFPRCMRYRLWDAYEECFRKGIVP
jgi:hypothetical protein